jgi:iron complex transport system ATP-binding protein
MEPAFRLRAATVWRRGPAGRRVLLDAVDWEAAAGQHWALLGPNGAGKTTLLTLVAAVKHPSAGVVEVLGRRLGRCDVFRLREEIGFVDARLGRRFLPTLTVEEVVATGATNTIALLEERVTPSHRERVEELLATAGIAHLRASRFGDCSHGERTRALIARALVSRPRLLLLDEPGAGLDFEGRETVLAALAALAASEPTLTTVTTTHHVEELAPTTTHALLLREGRVVAAGATAEVLTAHALTECFGLPIKIARTNGRWSAVAARAPQP